MCGAKRRNPDLTRLMQAKVIKDKPPAISDRSSGLSTGNSRPLRGREFLLEGFQSLPNFNQAALTVAGSILTPTPCVDEIATRLT